MAEIAKAYEPGAVEEKWYARWLAKDCFTANPDSPNPAYSIVIPPPNVTGVLTLGHVLNNTIQDILARRARMLGHEVLWLPGTDHAGIATQTVVERKLRREEGKTRHDLGREEFLRRVWEWKEKHGGIIIEQLKKLGCSCDWTRERFTMDPDYSREVQRVFVELYKKGLIYRGKRMVNWDPAALTALSDEEVTMKPTHGTLYYIRYEVAEEPGTFLEVATTRPETLMGDTAVAVHPGDPRYQRFLGKHCWRPFPRSQIPIIADEHIDPEFGTGALKVTPAHDKADFEIGQRHGLDVRDVMNPNATLNELAGPEFAGMDRFAARKIAAEKLNELGLLVKEEPYQNNVGYSERTEVPIEPRLSEQWFLRYPKVKESRDAVRNGEVRFRPERWANVYEHWMANIQDWCISRQLWWGHRIPVWYRKNAESGFRIAESEEVASAENLSAIRNPQSAIHVGIEPPPDRGNWTQDPDVLDTWFSSWLWPFATMDAKTRAKFYPTTDLVTAPDIIFFWVARMIVAGFEFAGERPFSNVFFTGLIRDSRGRKMSKSLGNSPDPLDLISKYGADGLRFGLMRIAPQGQDIRFDEKQVEEGRNFANKLWNAARFRQMHGPSSPNVSLDGLLLSVYSIDILARLDDSIRKIDAAYRDYKFSDVASALYEFFWSEYCDWYVEAAKMEIFSEDATAKESALAVMDYVLSRFLRLLHPFMPHITEELWERFGFHAPNCAEDNFILFAQFPSDSALAHIDRERISGAQARVMAVFHSVRAARNLRAEHRIPSNKKVRFILKSQPQWVAEELPTFARLVNATEVTIDPFFQPKSGVPRALSELGELYLPLEDLVDAGAERGRINQDIARVEVELDTVRRKLGNSSFTQNAPAKVVADHRKREQDWQERLAQLRKMLGALEGGTDSGA